MTTPIQDTILSQLAAVTADKSIDPMSVAKAIERTKVHVGSAA